VKKVVQKYDLFEGWKRDIWKKVLPGDYKLRSGLFIVMVNDNRIKPRSDANADSFNAQLV
jgi:hypothetical protein